MICTECGKPIEQTTRAVSEFVGEHAYTKKHCAENSPHMHVSCAPIKMSDLPLELFEPMRMKKP